MDLRMSAAVRSEVDNRKVAAATVDKHRIISLREMRMQYRWNAKRKVRAPGCCSRFCQWLSMLSFSRIRIPFLIYHYNYVNTNFGAGVAQFFMQMRTLIIINLLAFLPWIFIVIVPWFAHTPTGSALDNWNPSASPQDKDWFHRDDLDWQSIQGLFGTGTEYAVYASWFYYSGYPGYIRWNFNGNETGDEERYYIDAAYCTCIIVTYLAFFIGLFIQMRDNYSLRKVDLEVEVWVADRFKNEDLRYCTNKYFSIAVFAGLDHELCRDKGNAQTNVKSIFLVQLRMLFFQQYKNRGASIKFGDFIQYRPQNSSQTFYVHVAFNSKELYADLLEHEKGDDSKVDLFVQHSTYFISRYVLTNLKTWQPASHDQLKVFAHEAGFQATYNDLKHENFWKTNSAQKCVMDFIFKKGQYTDEFRAFHRCSQRQ
jgi:hypothetical protein